MAGRDVAAFPVKDLLYLLSVIQQPLAMHRYDTGYFRSFLDSPVKILDLFRTCGKLRNLNPCLWSS